MGSTYDSASSLDPLPDDIRHGMIAMGIAGLLSTISTISLFSFLTFRMLYWRRYYSQPLATNQVFILIYNLLLADFQQALSFLISFYWISQNKLVGPNPTCFAQGWLIQIGDVSSGLWVLAIAVHTFVSLVGQKNVPERTFIAAVVSLWMFVLILTAIGPVLNESDFFVPAGAWCWINESHQYERLYLHYLWIFTAQMGSLVIYIYIFFFLRHQLRHSSGLSSSISKSASGPSTTSMALKSPGIQQPASPGFNFNGNPGTSYARTTTTVSVPVVQQHDPFLASRNRILRTARYMVVYPFAYVALTLPLAAARVSVMAGRTPPLYYFPIAGTLMACCGIVDVLLYLSTRKALLKSSPRVKNVRDSENGNGNGLQRYRTAESARNREQGGNSVVLKGMTPEDRERRTRMNGGPRSAGRIMVERGSGYV